MTALALSLLAKFWPYILGAIALVFGAWKIDRNATARERAKQAAAEAKARDVRDEVQNDVGAMSADQVRAELAKRASK